MVGIFRLDKKDDLHRPRRIMKYILIGCSSGHLTLVVDEEVFELTPQSIITLTSGQVHFVKEMQDAKGFVLEFTLDFFCKDDIDVELIFHNGLFCHFALNEVIPIENYSFIETELENIEEELVKKPYQYLISVHSRIKLILVEINRAKVNLGHEIWKPDALFLKFLEQVRNNFDKNYSVTQLADQLGTTEAKLNEQAKLHAGKTAQNVIYGLVASEARRLLIYENLNVKEVAYRLGFRDPFYFSNFFKKHTGLSPRHYQAERRL